LGVGQRNHPSNGNGLLSTSSDDAGILDYTRVFGYHKLGDQCPFGRESSRSKILSGYAGAIAMGKLYLPEQKAEKLNANGRIDSLNDYG